MNHALCKYHRNAFPKLQVFYGRIAALPSLQQYLDLKVTPYFKRTPHAQPAPQVFHQNILFVCVSCKQNYTGRSLAFDALIVYGFTCIEVTAQPRVAVDEATCTCKSSAFSKSEAVYATHYNTGWETKGIIGVFHADYRLRARFIWLVICVFNWCVRWKTCTPHTVLSNWTLRLMGILKYSHCGDFWSAFAIFLIQLSLFLVF